MQFLKKTKEKDYASLKFLFIVLSLNNISELISALIIFKI